MPVGRILCKGVSSHLVRPDPASACAGNVRSLSDMRGAAQDDDDGQNEYYAGGEKSGQVWILASQALIIGESYLSYLLQLER